MASTHTLTHTHASTLAYALSLTGNSSEMAAPKMPREMKTKQNKAKRNENNRKNLKQTKYYFSHKFIYRVYTGYIWYTGHMHAYIVEYQ